MRKAAIFLSTFNKHWYTMAALYSVLNQEINLDYDVYVRENSTDPETISYVKKFSSLRFYLDKRTDDDPIGGFNWFYKTAPADYLFCTHDDIILHPDFLRKMIDKMDQTGHNVYCASQFVRFDRRNEYYTTIDKVFTPNDPPEEFHGHMELFQIGMRKETIAKLEGDLYTPYDANASDSRTKTALDNQNTFDKLGRLGEYHPVVGSDGKAEVLMTHFATEFSTWQLG